MKQKNASFKSLLTALVLLVGACCPVRADHVLVADGPSQNLKSVGQIYSTSTSQPAILAIRGGTILSISDLVTILPPGGTTGLQAEDSGSRITAENPTILALGLGQTGISAVRAVNGGLVILEGGKIGIAGGSSIGLMAENGTVNVSDAVVISMTGPNSYGVEASGSGLVQINPGATITTSGIGGFGIFTLAGGTVTANGISITTSGFLSPGGFNADGAATMGGTINLENSSITTSGDNADGLHVLSTNGEIIGTNLTIVTSGRIAAGAEADNGGSIQLRGGSISTSNDGSFGLGATNGANVTAQGITVNTAGANADGAFALTNGTINLTPGTVISTSGRGSYGLLAMSGGNIIGNGISVTTTGGLGLLLNSADGAATTGGKFNLENSSITTSGDNADGLHVLGGNGAIIGTNLAIVTSGRIAAGAEADNGGSIQLSGGSISTGSDGSFGLIATNGANITAEGITVNTAGANAYGAFARTNGTINLDSGTVINTSGRGSYGLLAMSGGNIVGNGITVTTTGGLELLLNSADGAATMGGKINL